MNEQIICHFNYHINHWLLCLLLPIFHKEYRLRKNHQRQNFDLFVIEYLNHHLVDKFRIFSQLWKYHQSLLWFSQFLFFKHFNQNWNVQVLLRLGNFLKTKLIVIHSLELMLLLKWFKHSKSLSHYSFRNIVYIYSSLRIRTKNFLCKTWNVFKLNCCLLILIFDWTHLKSRYIQIKIPYFDCISRVNRFYLIKAIHNKRDVLFSSAIFCKIFITILIRTIFTVDVLIHNCLFFSSELCDWFRIFYSVCDSRMRSTDVSVLNSHSIHDLFIIFWNRQSTYIFFICEIVWNRSLSWLENYNTVSSNE